MIKDRVIKAYVFAQEAHKGQKRRFSGLDYFCHPKGVARAIEDLTKDEDMVIAGFLHDVIEDTHYTYRDILDRFGKRVADLVFEVTTLKQELLRYPTKAECLLNKMLLMTKDGLTLKLVDREDNVHYMDKDCKTTEHKQFVKRYALETKFIIENLSAQRELTEIQKFLVDKINLRLRYLDIKYLW